ncbi:phage protein Gp36 family protein [Bacteroides sp. OF04-15BH]|uniref:phage protein Gp36 family protein n=1 Tax=Bacteroides sp. OF04-15BH TaxID=2292281 RepID=UPI001F18AB82|nr:phage protein Gp36 family protein [Bacteroides sp. OF04-15BH]
MVTMFITEEDYIQVSSDALKIIQQANEANRLRAERRATERITSYLGGRYDMEQAFAAEGESRNDDLVGLMADLALYFMVLSLPQKMGYEVRKEQYEKAVAYLKEVQSGKVVMNLPAHSESEEDNTGDMIRYGSDRPNNYIW